MTRTLPTNRPAQASEEEARSIGVEGFEAPLTSFLLHRVGNREQAADLAQDVFVKAYRSLLGGAVVPPASAAAWLYRIAANSATDALRRRRLITWLPLSLLQDDLGIGAGWDDTPSSPRRLAQAWPTAQHAQSRGDGQSWGRFEEQVADRQLIERIFAQLPASYAACLWLSDQEGLSLAEVADALHLSVSLWKQTHINF